MEAEAQAELFLQGQAGRGTSTCDPSLTRPKFKDKMKHFKVAATAFNSMGACVVALLLWSPWSWVWRRNMSKMGSEVRSAWCPQPHFPLHVSTLRAKGIHQAGSEG